MSLKNTLKKVRQGIIKTFKAKNVVPVYVQKENNNILNGPVEQASQPAAFFPSFPMSRGRP